MSFICSNCAQPTDPRVKPFIVPDYRDHIHRQVDEKGQTIEVGRGPQIDRESWLCPECSKVPAPKSSTPVDVGVLKTFANGFAAKHARKCTGTLKQKRRGLVVEIACQTCVDIKATFDAMPTLILSMVLE